MKEIEEKILEFLDNETANENDFQYLNNLFDVYNIKGSKYELKAVLRLISKISNNHYRLDDFIEKIELIINLFHKNIKKYFSNSQIFNIFKKNKRILLYLFEENILIPDLQIFNNIIVSEEYKKQNYLQYFYNEFKFFINRKQSNQESLVSPEIDKLLYGEKNQIKVPIDEPNIFEQKRKNGVNDEYICELIRKDLVIDFISYLNRNHISPSSNIKTSIYETNLLLNKNGKPTIIEYSAFYGSIQIFRYLIMNNVKLEQSLWFYSIH